MRIYSRVLESIGTMEKTYILDTNVLLTDPNALFSFEEHNIVLPLIVLEELDRHKDRQDEVGRNARETIRKLTELTKENRNIKEGVARGPGLGMLKILSDNDVGGRNIDLPDDLTKESGDNKIARFFLGYKEQFDANAILVTRDLNLQIKCTVVGITWENYRKFNVAATANSLYTGTTTISDVDLSEFYRTLQSSDEGDDFILQDEVVDQNRINPNQFLILKGENGGSAIARFTEKGKPLVEVKKITAGKFVPRNKEQEFAMNLLFDDKVKLVTLVGRAGSGKTLSALAAGLEQVVGTKKRYKNLLVCRPVQPVGKDIGFLPGPQPLDAKVLTPTGWSTMGALKVGDKVTAADGSAVSVLGVFPKGEKEILRLTFEDGVVVECCEDHPWNTFKPHEKKTKTRSTKTIEEDLALGVTHKRHYIEFVSPVQYQQSSDALPIDPYTLGALLGDGCWTADYALELSSGDHEIVEKIQEKLPSEITLRQKYKFSWSFVMTSNIGRKRRERNTYNQALKNLGVWGTDSHSKFIPDRYMCSTIPNRVALMQGLMDTDGYVSADGSDVSLTTCSKQMAEQFKELVLSLGGFANVKHSQAKEAYTVSVSFWSGSDIKPFSLPRKADRYKPRSVNRRRRILSVERTGKFVPMQCINIDHKDHLYVTNGFVVTHNTLEEKMEPWIAPIKDNLRFLITEGKRGKFNEQILEDYFAQGIIEIEAMTFIRGRSIANAFMIIDESQNLTVHELKTILTRVGEGTKIVLTGDVEQIDHMYIDSVSNGLTVAVERFKDQPIAGHVTLVKGERSELATIASQIL